MGIRKTFVLTSAASFFAVSLSASALAETFTFNSTSEPGGTITLELPEGLVTAGSVSGSSTSNFSSGETQSSKFTCHSMTEAPSATFDMTGLCEVIDDGVAGNNYKILFGCNYANEERTASSCWGGLFGTGGRFDGKSGTVSWSSKDGASSGTGQWN